VPVINPIATPTPISGLNDITGPCADWPVKWPCDITCVSPTVTGAAVTMATETLWALTGRQFGLCEIKIRPCRRECEDSYWPVGWSDVLPGSGGFVQPALIGGQWYNLTCGNCAGNNCSCTSISEVALVAPVHSIVEVKIDGTPLVTGSYRLDDSRLLVRTDGSDWPRCNDLNENDTEVGTWSITAQYGQLVPEGGAWAVGELACQFIRAINGEDCTLPQTVQSLARQGVTISFPNPQEWYKQGLTGLYLVDMFIRTWNPHGLTQRSRVMSVDGALSRRVM